MKTSLAYKRFPCEPIHHTVKCPIFLDQVLDFQMLTLFSLVHICICMKFMVTEPTQIYRYLRVRNANSVSSCVKTFLSLFSPLSLR